MTFLKSTLFVLSLIILVGCSSKKTTAEEMTTHKELLSAEKMMEQGFKMGTIVASKTEGDCPYVIEVKGEDKPYFLDPINLEEKYKKDGANVWFTFGGLRMMNRCEKANPVSIIEIRNRE